MYPFQTSIGILFILTTLVTIGYIGFGSYIYWTYEQVGIGSLSLFSCAWGLNFLVSSVVVFVLFSAGIESGLELTGISFSRPLELFMISTTGVRGLLTIGSIFAWFWFVNEYTTRPRRRDDLFIIGLGIGLTIIATLNGFVGALTAFGYIGLQEGFIEFASLLEILGTGIAIGVGTAQLFRTARNHPPFKFGAAMALAIPVVFPYLLRYLYQFALIPDFQTILLLRFLALLAGFCGLGLATTRYRLFDQLPAAQVLGRERSFETTSTAIAVLGDNEMIADLNSAARSLFGVDGAGAIGESLDTILPRTVTSADLTGEGTHTFEFPDTGTVIESETTVTMDERGREFGSVIVFKDITEERRRQQRIQVLNRVLRHNLRNNLVVAHGHIDVIERENEPVEENVSQLKGTLRDLVEMGAKAGEIENVLKTEPEVDTPRPLADIVRMALNEAGSSCDLSRAEVTAEERISTTANPVIVQSILTELVINAIEHTDNADVTVSFTDDCTGIVVADNGPGIPDNEVKVFASGVETPLQHGNGLGLWLVKWGTGLLGASLDLDTDDTGTSVTLVLPEDMLATDTATQTDRVSTET
jgi:PAS domain S-box-containing protein